MHIKEAFLGAAFAAIFSAVGYAGSSFVDMTRLLTTNSSRIEHIRLDLEYLKTEVVSQGKDIAAIKAELSEEEIASLLEDPDTKGG